MKNKFISSVQFAQTITKVAFLYKNIWKEFKTCLLHAPRQNDKSALAVDIAVSVASDERKVVYVNTEGHIEDHIDRLSQASNLYVFTPEYESIDDTTDYADLVISGIEEAIATTDVRTFVIDSVTRIAALSFGRNASAAYVMKRLVALQVRCKLSLLIISHDSTKSAYRALLNLSDSEISLAGEPQPEKHPAVDKSEPAATDVEPIEVAEMPKAERDADRAEIDEEKPRRQLSRRDRRMLRRQNQANRR